jgi:hypothetical protein
MYKIELEVKTSDIDIYLKTIKSKNVKVKHVQQINETACKFSEEDHKWEVAYNKMLGCY